MIDKDQQSQLTAIVAITKSNQSSIAVKFVNPVDDKLQLSIEGSVSGSLRLDITDIQGRLLQRTSVDKDQQSWTGTINVRQLASGIYALRVRSADGQVSVYSFIKN